MSLSFLERKMFELSLDKPWIFRRIVKPELYRRSGGDPEAVHEYVLEMLDDIDVSEMLRRKDISPEVSERLKITVNGQRIVPFGTAAGMDKNCDALKPFSYIFGFQEPGTVVVHQRSGNNRPRIATDEKLEDLYNAQGFPSQGKEYVQRNLSQFRNFDPNAVIYLSICGLPLSLQRYIKVAMEEMETLLKDLHPYVNGFVWNPFSPNTAALTRLRTREIFRKTAELMKLYAPDKLRLVKMGPYEDNNDERKQSLALVNSFLKGGGHGVVTTNTKMFPKDQIPVRTWGYPSGGRSGRFLQPYIMRSVRDYRKAFPNAVIVATGGIFDGDNAYETFKAGATMLEGYTPYAFHGLGLLPKMERRVAQRLRQEGYQNLEQLQLVPRNGAKLLV